MKATGVVRRIDDLGRIVIPKEIRKNLRINDGEKVEIFIENDSIILKRFSTLNNIKDLSDIITFAFSKTSGKTVIITDTEEILSISGDLKKQIGNIKNSYINILKERKRIIEENLENIDFLDCDIKASYIIEPLFLDGDLIGSILILSNTIIDYLDIAVCDVVSKILTKYIEQ